MVGDIECHEAFVIDTKDYDELSYQADKIEAEIARLRKSVSEQIAGFKENLPQIKAGDILIAIDPCVMRESETFALIVEKEYIVQRVMGNGFAIKSELFEDHYFYVNEYSEYFKLKQ